MLAGLALARDLDGLGPPPVDDGPEVLDGLREAFRERSESIQDAATFIELEASPTSTVGLVQTARTAQAGCTAGPRLITEVSSYPALDDAVAATPACARMDANSRTVINACGPGDPLVSLRHRR